MIYRQDLSPLGRFLVDHPRLIPAGVVFAALASIPWNALGAAFSISQETWKERYLAQRNLEAIVERQES